MIFSIMTKGKVGKRSALGSIVAQTGLVWFSGGQPGCKLGHRGCLELVAFSKQHPQAGLENWVIRVFLVLFLFFLYKFLGEQAGVQSLLCLNFVCPQTGIWVATISCNILK